MSPYISLAVIHLFHSVFLLATVHPLTPTPLLGLKFLLDHAGFRVEPHLSSTVGAQGSASENVLPCVLRSILE